MQADNPHHGGGPCNLAFTNLYPGLSKPFRAYAYC